MSPEITVGVPVGWQLSADRGSVAMQSPAGDEGFTLSFWSYVTPAKAATGFCARGAKPEQLRANATIGPHKGIYEYYCPPVASLASQGFWNVFVPDRSGVNTWLWDYRGATGVQSGPSAATFLAVIGDFSG